MSEAIAKKGGPKTEAGKAISSRNATRHAILSTKPVVEGVEREEDWEAFSRGIFESLHPVGVLEWDLAYNVACLLWRRKRITRYESEAIMLSLEEVEEKIDRIWKVEETKYKRELLEELYLRKEEERVSGEDAVDILFRLEIDAGVTPYMIELPGVPNGVSYERVEWTVGMLKSAISAIAEHAEVSMLRLVDAAIESAKQEDEEALRRASRLIHDGFPEKLQRDRIYRERILPDEKTLGTVQRYEAHLTRQLNQTLHELEALQARRQGGSAPLARLDVQGLPGN